MLHWKYQKATKTCFPGISEWFSAGVNELFHYGIQGYSVVPLIT